MKDSWDIATWLAVYYIILYNIIYYIVGHAVGHLRSEVCVKRFSTKY